MSARREAGAARPFREAQALAALQAVLGRARSSWIELGIGDDAAILAPRGRRLVWTIDAAVEGVHFERRWLTLADVGFRSFNAAASDLAAMGARPLGALSALALPPAASLRDVAAIGRGQAEAARSLGCPVVGGNLSRASELSVTTTVLGEATAPLRRAGARPGDELWLVGEVGLARAGFELLRAGHPARTRAARACVAAWRRPHALLRRGVALAGRARACIDVSDGLAGDAAQLAQASGVRVIIDAGALRAALSPELAAVAAALGVEPLELALEGGEDYALLAAGARLRRPSFARVSGRVTRG
ncbi:MAG: thiamine-phosphate kinase, partial [Sorangiineae bacterium]|nr:thiamine-phosphate kinase [Sorangiineae bacterium]